MRGYRIDATPAGVTAETTAVATETPAVLEVDGAAVRSFMSTPSDIRALAVGYALTDGIINAPDDIAGIAHCPDNPTLIRMHLNDDAPGADTAIDTGAFCGLSGADDAVDDLLADLPPAGETLRISVEGVHAAADELRDRQTIFPRTGGTHAAAIFSANGGLVSFAEDVGRHNAVDKAIGLCALAEEATDGRAAVLSSRASFELIAKCARVGIELVAAVSAPSHLAVTAAEHWNITLCGFVREDRATVYTHPQRITELDELTAQVDT